LSEMVIKSLTPDDAGAVARIFHSAVHEGTGEHYTQAQRLAWGGEDVDPEGWQHRLAGLTGFVAELEGQPVGFMTIEASGYIDLAFVHPKAAGKGVGHRLYQAVEAQAHEWGATSLSTNASKAARGFFERQGWQVVAEQTAERQGVELTNYKMLKAL